MNVLILLAAIAIVETGDINHPELGPNDTKIGRSHREVSRYQFKPGTWAQYATLRSSLYQDPEYARRIALLHIKTIKTQLNPSQRQDVRAYAACWNMGNTGYRNHGERFEKLPRQVQRHVLKVERKYNELIAKQKLNR